jgi:sec-independent protein translocase protein TatB
MFDIGFMELCLIGVVALLVVGPERLPRLARTLGLWMGKARRFMSDVKSDIKAEMDQQDLTALKDIKSDLEQARDELQKTSSSMNETLTDEELMDHVETPAHLAAQTDNYVNKQKSTKKRKARSTAAKKKSKNVATTKKAGKKTSKKKTTPRKTTAVAKKTGSNKKKTNKRARS